MGVGEFLRVWTTESMGIVGEFVGNSLPDNMDRHFRLLEKTVNRYLGDGGAGIRTFLGRNSAKSGAVTSPPFNSDVVGPFDVAKVGVPNMVELLLEPSLVTWIGVWVVGRWCCHSSGGA